MSAITEKSSSNRKDHNCNHGIEKASRQLDKEKHPCITVSYPDPASSANARGQIITITFND